MNRPSLTVGGAILCVLLARLLPASPLSDAATSGDIPAITAALKAGSDIDERDEKNWTPLIHAIVEGRTRAAMLLLTEGAKVNVQTASGYTPLHFAGGCANPTVVRALLDRGARTDVVAESYKNTPLNIAVRGGSAKVIQLLLDQKLDPDAPQDARGNTALMLAANRGFDAVIETLLAGGAKVDKAGQDGWTPLMCAAAKGRLRTVKLLLAKGADPKLKNAHGDTASDCAGELGDYRFVRYEIEDALYSAMTGRSRQKVVEDLGRSIRTGDVAAVARILEDPAIFPSEGVLAAAASDNVKIARTLFDAGASPHVRNAAGFTAMLYAAIHGDAELVQLLLDHEADVNTPNREGLTPLMAAAKAGSLPVVKLLLAANADPSPLDDQGRSAQDIAEQKDEVEIATAIRAAAPVVQVSHFGSTLFKPGPDSGAESDDGPRASEAISQRLVLMPFSSADNSYRSTEAAKDLVALLEADNRLKDLPWVERSEIQKAETELELGGLNAPNSVDALRLGKWVGADLAIMGYFGLESGEGRELTVEVVDLRNADVLSHFSIRVKGELGAPLQVEPRDVATIAGKIASALTQSAAKLARADRSVTIAPLFFRNISSGGGRLDFLQDEVMEAFRQGGDARTKMLRFPGAAAAADERDLALAGLVDRDDQAWKKIADTYVWGSFEEIGSEGVPFDEVKVRINLEVWDGKAPPQKISETFPIGQARVALPNLVRRVIGQQKGSVATVDGVDSKQVARNLLQRVQEMEAAETDQFEAAKRSGPWLRRVNFGRQLLELARFFDPENEDINQKLLIERWGFQYGPENLKGPVVASPFEMLWKRSEAWGAYVDRFGLASVDRIPVNPIISDRAPRAVVTGNKGVPPYVSAYLDLPYNFARVISSHDTDSGFPDGVPLAVAQEWKRHFLEEFLERLRLVARDMPDRFDLRLSNFFPYEDSPNDQLIDDARLRASVFALVWKLSAGEKMSDEDRHRDLKRLQSAMGAGGMEAEMDALLDSDSGPRVGDPGFRLGNSNREEEKKKVAERNAALLDRKDTAPGEVMASFQALVLGEKEQINSLAISVVAWGAFWSGVQNFGNTDQYCDQVWSYEPASDRSIPYAGLRAGLNQAITGLVPHGAELWVGTDGAGVWRFDTGSKVITKFSADSGLPTPYLHTTAITEREIFFGGGDDKAGKVCVFDFGRKSWASLAPGGDAGLKRPLVHRIAANSSWLLVSSKGQFGADPSYYDLFDTRSRKWAPAPIPEFSTQYFRPSIVADPSGFWVGGGSRLVHLVPPSGTTAANAIPQDAALEGEISAMADDGDYLWIAAAALAMKPGYLWECSTRLYHVRKMDGRVVNFTRVPYNGPIVSISSDAERLWLGLDTRYDSPVNLLVMSKAAFAPDAHGR